VDVGSNNTRADSNAIEETIHVQGARSLADALKFSNFRENQNIIQMLHIAGSAVVSLCGPGN